MTPLIQRLHECLQACDWILMHADLADKSLVLNSLNLCTWAFPHIGALTCEHVRAYISVSTLAH